MDGILVAYSPNGLYATMTKHAPDAMRTKIAQAAITLILTKGADAFTLDAVVKHAGVTKGGLLHHFPSKHALSLALMQHCFASFEARIHALAAKDRDPAAGRWLRAYINATFDVTPEEDALVRALFALTSASPSLLNSTQADMAAFTPKLPADGVPRLHAEVIRLACDGFWINEQMGWTQPSATMRKRLRRHLLVLLAQGSRSGDMQGRKSL